MPRGGDLWRWLGHKLFRTRNALFPLVLLPVALLSRPRPFLGSARWDVVLDVVGLLVACAGQGLRVLVIGLQYIERGGLKRRIHASRLVQGGLFAHSRNPLYVGNLGMIVGVSLIHHGVAMYVVVIPFFLLAYSAIVAAEEEFLRREFGAEYEDYCRRVPRFFPRLSGLGATVRSMRFDWRRVARKEYVTLLYFATMTLGALAWERIAWHGVRAHRTELVVLAALWCTAVAGFVAIRLKKKAGALASPASFAPEPSAGGERP